MSNIILGHVKARFGRILVTVALAISAAVLAADSSDHFTSGGYKFDLSMRGGGNEIYKVSKLSDPNWSGILTRTNDGKYAISASPGEEDSVRKAFELGPSGEKALQQDAKTVTKASGGPSISTEPGQSPSPINIRFDEANQVVTVPLSDVQIVEFNRDVVTVTGVYPFPVTVEHAKASAGGFLYGMLGHGSNAHADKGNMVGAGVVIKHNGEPVYDDRRGRSYEGEHPEVKAAGKTILAAIKAVEDNRPDLEKYISKTARNNANHLANDYR